MSEAKAPVMELCRSGSSSSIDVDSLAQTFDLEVRSNAPHDSSDMEQRIMRQHRLPACLLAERIFDA